MCWGVWCNQPVAVVDGATQFNSYTLSRIAALLAIPPKVLLQRTHVTRSFTAFQTEAAITTKLRRFLAATPCRTVVILGLLNTYYDEQIKPHECRQSLQRIMQTLTTLAAENIHTLIADVEVRDAPPGKEMLFGLVHDAANVIVRIGEHGFEFHKLFATPHEEKGPLPWDATTIPSRISSTGTESHGTNFAER